MEKGIAKMEPKYVCAGIEYATGKYGRASDVHSDACPLECLPENIENPEWRRFIHDTLDEWLDRSGGTGYFAIGGNEFWSDFSNGSVCNDKE